MRSDTPYADLYEASQEVSAMALAAAYWAIDILRDSEVGLRGPEDVVSATRVLRVAMKTRREMRVNRSRLLAESFAREIDDAR